MVITNNINKLLHVIIFSAQIFNRIIKWPLMSSRSNQLKDEILNQIAEQIKGVSVGCCGVHVCHH